MIPHLRPMNKYPSSLMDDMTIIILNRLLHFAPKAMDTTIGVPIQSKPIFQSHTIHHTRRIIIHWYQIGYHGPAILSMTAAVDSKWTRKDQLVRMSETRSGVV